MFSVTKTKQNQNKQKKNNPKQDFTYNTTVQNKTNVN